MAPGSWHTALLNNFCINKLYCISWRLWRNSERIICRGKGGIMAATQGMTKFNLKWLQENKSAWTGVIIKTDKTSEKYCGMWKFVSYHHKMLSNRKKNTFQKKGRQLNQTLLSLPLSHVCITVTIQHLVFYWENAALPGNWPCLFVYQASESDELRL